MQSRAFPILALPLLAAAAACGGADRSSSSESGPGSGQFSVTSDRPIAGSDTAASYSIAVSFTTEPSCTTQPVSACTVNPCYQSSRSGNANTPLPSAGQVTFAGVGTTSLALAPQSDGNYATETVAGQLPWETGGSAVTFEWARFPGNAGQPGDSIVLSTPPYVALVAGSAFAAETSTVVRDHDLTVSWTSDSAPSELDDVAVDVSSASVQVYCIFPAASGTGVVPAAVLGLLEPGDGTYDVHSKENAYERIDAGEGSWGMSFNVDAHARTSYGLAKGSVTIR